VYNEIERTFKKLLKSKNARKEFTIEAASIPLIVKLMEEAKTRTIRFSYFWDRLQLYVKGIYDERKPNGYQSEYFFILIM
jgi:hypothetical protein